jgi:acyl carrier protein
VNLIPEEVRDTIRAKVIALAHDLGVDASELQNDEIIPATGFLDSAAVLELIVWYESEYDIPLKQEEINIDNLGSVNAMVDFLLHRKQA